MGKYSLESRKTVENYIGRSLFTDSIWYQIHPKFYSQDGGTVNEVVHHINRNTKDNRIMNLYVFRNQQDHLAYHNKLKYWAYGLCGLSWDEKVEYLKTFPELDSNLDLLRIVHIDGKDESYYRNLSEKKPFV